MEEMGGTSQAVALDLILRTFMNFSEFNDIQNKNWETIAKLIPGTTPQEVIERSLFMPGGWKKWGGGGTLWAVALDLMLRTFMNSSEFNNIQNKNWDAVAKLIPGTTPHEVRPQKINRPDQQTDRQTDWPTDWQTDKTDRQNKTKLFYGRTDLSSKVAHSGLLLTFFFKFFYRPIILTKMTIKTQKFWKDQTFFCRKNFGKTVFNLNFQQKFCRFWF